MFTADFFPTPRAIARRMYQKIQNKNAEYWLEPSAGKGDLANVIRCPTTIEELEEEDVRLKMPGLTREERGERSYRRERDREYSAENSRIRVDTIEAHPGLCAVLRDKHYDVVGYDFLDYAGTSYYDAILMNPPFSNGAAHLLKAWDFLYKGEIVCLLNEETIKNPYTEERKRLAAIIEKNAGTIDYLGDCFSTAENKTQVRVAMVYLKKDAPDDTLDMWASETKRTSEKDPGVEFGGDPNMLAIRDNLGNMEHWYNMANEHFLKGIEHLRKSQLYMNQNKISDSHRYGSYEKDFGAIAVMAFTNVYGARAEFLRRHRRNAWISVFQQVEFHKLLDSQQQETFLRDVERDSTIPFTAENIRETLRNVFLQRRRLFEESVSNVFDELCSNAIENGSGPQLPKLKSWQKGEGWKTNDTYKVNEKLIFPSGCRYEKDWGDFRSTYGDVERIYTDLDRILCVLDARPFEQCLTVGAALNTRFQRLGKLHHVGSFDNLCESDYFIIRFWKKGTVHLKWKRKDLLDAFNKTAAAGKKWLGADTSFKKAAWRNKPDYYCEHHGHEFEDGACKRCDRPEADPLAEIKCALCRAVAEVTGEPDCPLHPIHLVLAPSSDVIALLEASVDHGAHDADVVEVNSNGTPRAVEAVIGKRIPARKPQLTV